MHQDEIIRMARDAGFDVRDGYVAYCDIDDIKTFAELVAAAERAACEGVCGELANNTENSEQYRMAANWCRERIRARGEA